MTSETCQLLKQKLKLTIYKTSLEGIGYSMMVVSFLCTVYYNVIIAWCLYYLSQSLRSEVPWKRCGNSWNSDKCSTTGERSVSWCDLQYTVSKVTVFAGLAATLLVHKKSVASCEQNCRKL